MGQLNVLRLPQAGLLGTSTGDLFSLKRRPFINNGGAVAPVTDITGINVTALTTGTVVTIAVNGVEVRYTVPAVVPTLAEFTAALVNALRLNGTIGTFVAVSQPAASTIRLTGRSSNGLFSAITVTATPAAQLPTVTATTAAANPAIIPFGRIVTVPVAANAGFIPDVNGLQSIQLPSLATDILKGVSHAGYYREQSIDPVTGRLIIGAAPSTPLEVQSQGEIWVEADTAIAFTGGAQPTVNIRFGTSGQLNRRGVLTTDATNARAITAADNIAIIGPSYLVEPGIFAVRVSLNINA